MAFAICSLSSWSGCTRRRKAYVSASELLSCGRVGAEVGADGRLTGALRGANVRGMEKVCRLDEWIGDRPATVWAYGDSHGDRELLARADHPIRVGRQPLAPAPEGTADDAVNLAGAGRPARGGQRLGGCRR